MEIPKAIKRLNEYLRLQLGSNPFGEPIYKWAWTEDLFWPAMPTGRLEESRTPSGLFVMSSVCARKRMTEKYFQQWIIVRWIPAEGFNERECGQLGVSNNELPVWTRDFPGAPYPSRGYYYHLAHTEIKHGDIPNRRDTDEFIGFLKAQLSKTAVQHHDDWLAGDAAKKESARSELRAELADNFTAYLKIPGVVDGEISFGGVGESPLMRPKRLEVSEPQGVTQ